MRGFKLLISANIGPGSRFAFLHIPKTGGTSVRNFFCDIFGGASVRWHGVNFDIQDLTSDIPDHIRVIGGHLSVSQIDHLLSPEFHRIAVVREPADRIASYHQFILRVPEHPLLADLPFREVNADLEASEGFRVHVRNQQAHYLSEDGRAASVRRLVERGALSIATLGELEHFLREIAARAATPYCAPPRKNFTPGTKPTLTPTSRQIIEDITIEDRVLFHHVLQAEGQLKVFGLKTAARTKSMT